MEETPQSDKGVDPPRGADGSRRGPDNAVASPGRLEALRRAHVLDTPPEEAFDRLTRLAAAALRVPVSLVSLVDEDRQFFKSCAGTLPEPWHARRQTPLSHSFCQHAVATAQPLVINDAREHPLVKDNGAVESLGVVAYAGVPLVLSDGHAVGSFCVIDSRPRQWTAEDLDVLHTLAASAVGELELRCLLRERQAAGDELRRNNDILRAVTEGTGDAIFVKDRQGRYLMINPAAARMVGKAPHDIIGRDDTFLFDAETAARVMAHDKRVIAGGGVEAEEKSYPMPGGPRTLSTFKAPYRDADGNILGVIGIARDVTERRNAARELEKAKEQAEAANRAKDQFLAVLSHELRTPLAPVLALAGAWEADGSLQPPELREDMGLIRRNVELEVRLIDDLLDLTRVASGKLVLSDGPADAHALLRNTLRTCSTEDLVSKSLRLESDLAAAAPFVRADPARLQQVIWNLLNNAIKFTPAGGRIVVSTRNEGEPAESGGQRLVVEVCDTGVGIAPETLPKIFEPFEQGAAGVTRRFGGLGLGLSICKALVGAMGGRITAESDGAGKGATFRVELETIEQPAVAKPRSPDSATRPPLAASSAGASANGNGNGAASPDGTRPLRILVVDDHADTSKVMGRLLTRLGYQVRTAGTVHAAVEAMEADPADVVISDLALPDGHGHDLMRRLRQSRPGVKGIALTGFGTEEDVRKSHDAGFHTHLTKPTDFDHLLQTIRALET